MLNVAAIWTPEHQQQTFRTILEAMSRPGSLHAIHFDEQSNTLSAVLATLLDGTVTLADPGALVSVADWPLLQSSQDKIETADFIICKGQSKPDITPKLGTLESPEQSATLILKVESLIEGALSVLLTGPGINGSQSVSISGLDTDWLSNREDWVCEFPLGVDLILIDDKRLIAIPRTTKVEVK
jgi:alpha-D-ribose 1-methylphosphonate 5-triphosphate synthase subunit PhnH